MNKSDVLAQFENANNNFILGLAGLSLLIEPDLRRRLMINNVTFGRYNISFCQVAELMHIEQDRILASKEFVLMLFRGLIKESYELAVTYAKATGQQGVLTSQSWFSYIRLIRNALSHDFILHIQHRDMSLLPISWNGRTITEAMNGLPIPIEFLGYDGMLELFEELRRFVKEEMT